jgi:hypothetical protein
MTVPYGWSTWGLRWSLASEPGGIAARYARRCCASVAELEAWFAVADLEPETLAPRRQVAPGPVAFKARECRHRAARCCRNEQADTSALAAIVA